MGGDDLMPAGHRLACLKNSHPHAGAANIGDNIVILHINQL